jgi:Skp family chaperone for outer membrane proteins
MKKTISTLLIAACLSHTTFAASKTDIAHKVGLGVLATVAVIAGGSTMCLKAKSNRLEKEFEENNALLAKNSSLLEAKNKEIALRDQALRVTSKQFKNIDARRTVRDENQKTSKKRYDIRKAARKARDQKIGLGDIKITNISPMSKDLELQFGSLSE